ncbi:IniB N-terminal domain-containing protein [Paenarthrobacter sp. S56]|uniref:IniB N-terminal domain-containing protein n=1 Tax=Paenarthrobacter sp. S56 TaxID=3138179 RepID=UPI00321A1459
MPTLAQQLVQFLMSLFNNPEAAEDFVRDPEAALAAAGLHNVSSADVDAVRPVVLDYAPINARSSFDREYNTGGNHASTGGSTHHASTGGSGYGGWDGHDDDHGHGGGGGGWDGHDDDDGHGGGGWDGHDDHDDDGHGGGGGEWDDHAHAVQQLIHVVNNYSYTTNIDDRDTINDQSVNQNIWANGDVSQVFNQEAVIASGDGAIAAGDDVRDSGNTTTTTTTTTNNYDDHSDDHSLNITNGSGEVNVGNTDIEVNDSFNDNSDHSVIKDSYNTTDSNNTTDSYNTDVDVDVRDSFNETTDNSTHTTTNTDNSDHSTNISDSFNHTDNSTDVDVDANIKIDDSFNTDNSVTDNSVNDSFNGNTLTDNSVNDSFNGNTTDVSLEDVQVNYDSTVIQDNELNVDYTDIDAEDSLVVADNNVDVDVEAAPDHGYDPAH